MYLFECACFSSNQCWSKKKAQQKWEGLAYDFLIHFVQTDVDNTKPEQIIWILCLLYLTNFGCSCNKNISVSGLDLF